MGQIIAAIAGGNSVVCKTSDFTPKCGALIQKCLRASVSPIRSSTSCKGGAESPGFD